MCVAASPCSHIPKPDFPKIANCLQSRCPCPHVSAQVRHSRKSGVLLKVEKGRLGGARALKLSAARSLPGGGPLTMDFGPERLDNQILLDYGVIDEEDLQVCVSSCTPSS